MLIWMSSVEFPPENEVLEGTSYGYNAEFLGLVDYKTPNISMLSNGIINLIKTIPTTPPELIGGKIKDTTPIVPLQTPPELIHGEVNYGS